MKGTAMLTADEVCVTAGRARLLTGVSAAVEPGRMLAVLGPNGAGKSTLLSVLSGERAPSAGRVRLDGHALATLPPRHLACRRALVTQHPSAGFAFSVDEVMTIATETGPLGAAERRRLIAECLHAADALSLAGRLLPHLSGGESQRVAFARALAQLAAGGRGVEGAPYLLLDEPTASLDPAHQHHLLRAARAWVARTGGGCAVILHDITLAARYCDHGLLLAGGRAVWSGPMDALAVPVLERVFATGFVRLPAPDGAGWIYAATGQPPATPSSLDRIASNS